MKTVVAAALGECVHVAGVINFLRLAEAAGWRTVFLGPAVPVEASRSRCAARTCQSGRSILPAHTRNGRAAAGRLCRGGR